MKSSSLLLLLFLAFTASPLRAGNEEDFRCVICKQVVSKGYQVEGRFYCPAHLDEALPKCRHCGKAITGNYVAVTERNYPICMPCRELPRCFLCTLPADPGGGGKKLADGRLVCRDHKQSGVVDEELARRIYHQAASEIGKVFGASLALKQPVGEVRLVDLNGLKKAAENGTHSSELKSGRVLGLTTITWSRHDGIRRMKPAAISLLSHVPPERMVAVAAHEYAHVWHAENNPEYLQTSAVFREGFAEWVTYKVSEALSRQEQTAIMKNPSGGDYYSGLVKFLELERRRGVEGVLDYAATATNI